MKRRRLLTTAGIVGGMTVAISGLYLSQLPASDQKAGADKGATVTMSQRQLDKLFDRLSSLETRVKALEKEKGFRLLAVPPTGKVIHPLYVQPSWPSDGFGPVQTIPAG